MKIKFRDLEVEAEKREDIEWLLTKIEELRGQSGSSSGGNENSGRRERFIQFPEGKFTVQSLAEDLGLSPATIYQRLKAMEEAGDAKIVGEIRKEGQRGRATAEWQVINFPEPQEQAANPSKSKFDIDLDEVPE